MIASQNCEMQKKHFFARNYAWQTVGYKVVENILGKNYEPDAHYLFSTLFGHMNIPMNCIVA